MAVLELENVTKRFGDITAVDSVTFTIEPGRIISLLGPSGCGKTTTLRLIAGFESPDEGIVRIGGVDMRGRRPYERNVGLLFQDYALFPHMTVEQNIGYGLRQRGMARRDIAGRVSEMLQLVQLKGYEGRRPSQLSGGEQQRVALARALAINPEVILLDEPLSALDAKLRQELRVELKEILAAVGTTSIVVTHDQEEAMSLSEHIIVMSRGRVMQAGSPMEIYASPDNKFVAEFIGRSNWFEGRLGAADGQGLSVFETADGIRLLVPTPAAGHGGGHDVCIRPERFAIDDGADAAASPGERTNALTGTVADAAPLGADVHLFVVLASGKRISVVTKNVGQSMWRPGQAVTLRCRPHDCIVVDSGSR